jgi:hypothetical protein
MRPYSVLPHHGLQQSASNNGMGCRRHCRSPRRACWRSRTMAFMEHRRDDRRHFWRHRARLAGSSVVVAASPAVDHAPDLDPLGRGLDSATRLFLSGARTNTLRAIAVRFCCRRTHASAGRLAQSPGRAMDYRTSFAEIMEKRTLRLFCNYCSVERRPHRHRSCVLQQHALDENSGPDQIDTHVVLTCCHATHCISANIFAWIHCE